MDIKKLTGRDAKHLVQLCLPLSRVKGEMNYPLFMSEKLALTITVMVLSTLLGIAKIVVEQKLIENANKIPTEQQDIKEML